MAVTFATIINKGGTDKTVINNVRTWLVQPFQAPDWLDLRVGFLLSLTQTTNDDTITGLAEEINPSTGPFDRYWIGVKTRGAAFPRTAGVVFIGYTSAGPGIHDGFGHTKLVTSDLAIGTTNAYFWRPKNTDNDLYGCAMILDGDNTVPTAAGDGAQQHFAQDAVGAGGYATLLMLRLQRSDVGAHKKVITATLKTAAVHSGDVLFTNTPTDALLRANLAAFPSTVQQLGPVTLSAVPDSFYLYWPFSLSRLRYHAVGILKAR